MPLNFARLKKKNLQLSLMEKTLFKLLFLSSIPGDSSFNLELCIS